jgi:hypothetical protein
MMGRYTDLRIPEGSSVHDSVSPPQILAPMEQEKSLLDLRIYILIC